MDQFITNLAHAFAPSGDIVFTLACSLFLFLTGSLVASFTGLIVHRIGECEDNEPIISVICTPSSFCENCLRKLTIIELIPVIGWILTKGKCKTCAYKVPVRYPVLEFFSGITSVLIPVYYGQLDLTVISLIGLFWLAIVISWVDIKHQIIPEELTWLILFCGLLFSPFESDIYNRVVSASLCLLIIWLSMVVVSFLKNENMHAGGDIALATASGAWVGVDLFPYYLLTVSTFYIVYAFPLRVRGVNWVPMGPALIVGLLFTLIFFHRLL